MNPVEKNTIDNYIRQTVALHTPRAIQDAINKLNGLSPHIHAWANGHQYELKLSGSIAKGTAITGTTDIDLFVSLNPSVKDYNTLENVYVTLRNRLTGVGYIPREQNVSLGINHDNFKVDVVPGVRQDFVSTDHSLWKRKQKTYTKTNVDKQIKNVVDSKRTFDIRAIKIWRKLRNLDFPSVYLELSVLEALNGYAFDNPSGNFICVMEYLAKDFVGKKIIDPSNSNNIISDELSDAEKKEVARQATLTLEGSWDKSIW